MDEMVVTPAMLIGITCCSSSRDLRGVIRLTITERALLYEAHGGQCWYCGVVMTRGADDRNRDLSRFTVDHLHQVCNGGQTVPGNIVAACRRCNIRRKRKKGDRASTLQTT